LAQSTHAVSRFHRAIGAVPAHDRLSPCRRTASTCWRSNRKGDTRNILVWKTDNLSAKPTVIGATAMQIRTASFLKNDMLAVTMHQPYDGRIDGEVTQDIHQQTAGHRSGRQDLERAARQRRHRPLGRGAPPGCPGRAVDQEQACRTTPTT
jgi:hypothetical protein